MKHISATYELIRSILLISEASTALPLEIYVYIPEERLMLREVQCAVESMDDAAPRKG